jgi:RimJ/RimL family protein N-acetyltransferase
VSIVAAQVIATRRLDLLPLAIEHAEEMAAALSDPVLHTFTGGAPDTLDGLRSRYRRLTAGSPDPGVSWLNWVIRLRDEGCLTGTVQATISASDRGHRAEIAWVVGTAWQGRGIATEAARGLVDWLDQQPISTVIAHIHPDHHASAAVAARAGLTPTDEWHGGEIRWRRSRRRRAGAERDDPLALASSFGAAATAYAIHRPDYARAAVHWALEPASGPRVLDLGAGTGKLTATLVALGVEVTAVEPDPRMLTELRRALPDVRTLRGSAEAIPLPEASVDAVLAGNAMHWFDMAGAGPEIARVLAPGGVLAGLWNVLDDRVDWVAGLARVGGSAAVGPRDTPTGWRAETVEAHLPRTGAAPRFGSPEQAEFPHGQRRTADSLVATVATRAGLLVMPEQDRLATLGRIRAFLASRPETANGEFTVPMLTCVLRVRRR